MSAAVFRDGSVILSFFIITDRSKAVLLSWILFVIYVSCLSCFLSVFCGLVVTCWEKADLLALLCVMFSCVFVASACGVLGQVWDLIVSIPDHCL